MADDDKDKPPQTRGCGTMQVHRRLLNTDSEYARRLTRIEELAFRASVSGPLARPGCTEIPVVVHIIHRTAAQNLTQAQIDSQIDVLNRDFRKTNTDISAVPAPFAPLAGDARITFKLATVDPDGNPTTGVTRTETRKNSFNADNDDVKFAAEGGVDAWPRDDYLNVWVCPRITDSFGSSILGYAQFPGGPAATDGVVILHTAFGTTGTAAPPFDKGRTTTHEIGHWLNLRHIWGDDGGGCSGSDFVSDTPNQGGPNFGKPSFPTVSCSNGPNGDMFMNYMDYVDDDTMVMFSEGQIARMQACLDGPRSSIGTSVSCGGVVGPGPKPIPKDVIKELPKDGIKEFAKDPPKEFPKEFIKEGPKDGIKENPKDLPKEFPKDFGKDLMKDPPKDGPKDGPKDFPKELAKEIPKDAVKDRPFDPGPKGIPKDGIFDPGPKNFIDDGPKNIIGDTPKNILGDIPGKGVKDPPKSALEPPFDPFTPGLPTFPVQPGPGVPFVMGTGVPQQQQQQPQDTRAQYLDYYAQILQHYAGLNQRGMLDSQGHAGWQQVWAAYQQLGGS